MKWLALVLLTVIATPAFAQDSGPSALVGQFMAAWRASDAKALSELFMPDADFINPFGTQATGRAEIEAFYAGAFAHGYSRTKGTGDVVCARTLSPGLALIDATFSISGARHEDGTPRPEEKGVLAAVVRKTADGWRIEALRENEGAGAIVPLQ